MKLLWDPSQHREVFSAIQESHYQVKTIPIYMIEIGIEYSYTRFWLHSNHLIVFISGNPPYLLLISVDHLRLNLIELPLFVILQLILNRRMLRVLIRVWFDWKLFNELHKTINYLWFHFAQENFILGCGWSLEMGEAGHAGRAYHDISHLVFLLYQRRLRWLIG